MKAYKFVCNCFKSPINELFPNKEYSTIKFLFINEILGICKICKGQFKVIEFEVEDE